MKWTKRGSSYIFVIVMVVFLVVLATGFYYMSGYNVTSTVENRTDTQGELLSRSLHSALCKKAADGKMDVLNRLVQKGKEDYEAYLEELEAYRENDEEGDVPEEPDPESEYQAESIWTMVMLDNSLYEEAWMKSEVTCKPFKGTAVITTHVKYKVTDVNGKANEYVYDLASDMTYGQQMEVVTKDPILVDGGEGGTPGYAVGLTADHYQLPYGDGTFQWNVEPDTEDGMDIIYANQFTIPWGLQLNSDLYASGDVTIHGPTGAIQQYGDEFQVMQSGNVYCVGGDVKGNITGGYTGWIAGDVYAKADNGIGGNIQLTQGPHVIGNVYADGDIGGEISRAYCVWAGGSIQMGNGYNHSFQSVEAVGDINIFKLLALEQEGPNVPPDRKGKVISREGSVTITNHNNDQWSERTAGEIRAKQDINLLGCDVSGDVIAQDGIVVLENSRVRGNVYARSVIIRGTSEIHGNIVAEELVDMTQQWPRVTVKGDLSCGSLKLQGNSIELHGAVQVDGNVDLNGQYLYLGQPVRIAGQLSFSGWAAIDGTVDITARSLTGNVPALGPGMKLSEDMSVTVTIPQTDRTVPETAPIPDCPVAKPTIPTDKTADFSAFEEIVPSIGGSGSGWSPVRLSIDAPEGKNVVYNLPDAYIKLSKVSVPAGQIVYLNLDAMDGKTLYMPTDNGSRNKIEGTLILYSTKNVTVKFSGNGKCDMKAQIYLPNGSVIVGNDKGNLKQEFTGTITAKDLQVINGAEFKVTPLPESFGNTGLGFEGGGGGGTSYPFPSVGVVPSGGSGWGVTRLYKPVTG